MALHFIRDVTQVWPQACRPKNFQEFARILSDEALHIAEVHLIPRSTLVKFAITQTNEDATRSAVEAIGALLRAP